MNIDRGSHLIKELILEMGEDPRVPVVDLPA